MLRFLIYFTISFNSQCFFWFGSVVVSGVWKNFPSVLERAWAPWRIHPWASLKFSCILVRPHMDPLTLMDDRTPTILFLQVYLGRPSKCRVHACLCKFILLKNLLASSCNTPQVTLVRFYFNKRHEYTCMFPILAWSSQEHLQKWILGRPIIHECQRAHARPN